MLEWDGSKHLAWPFDPSLQHYVDKKGRALRSEMRYNTAQIVFQSGLKTESMLS